VTKQEGYLALPVTYARLKVTVEAEGILERFRHRRSFSAPLGVERILLPLVPLSLPYPRIPIRATLQVSLLEPDGVEDLDERNRRILLENLHGEKVLFSSRFPTVEYAGDILLVDEGTLRVEGNARIRGKEVPLPFEGLLKIDPGKMEARFFWEGSLRVLGLSPFRGPLGIMWLKDWVRLEVEGSVEDPRIQELAPFLSFHRATMEGIRS